MAARRVLAIDPGTVKCGIALVCEDDPTPLFRSVVACRDLEDVVTQTLARYAPDYVVLGSGTASAELVTLFRGLGVAVQVVDEYGTTLAARARYYVAYPPKGWRRLIPAGLRIPPGPIDDWAAVVIAEQFLSGKPPLEKKSSKR